jgi:hypothetical protein
MDTTDYTFYKNNGFRNTRNRKQILILDVDDSDENDTHLGLGGEFNIKLFEPLRIDTLSEVYLDNFITFNSNISNITENSAYVLKINEFNINSNVASSKNPNEIYNSIVIPNEHSTATDNHGVVLHKAKKFNYVCDINPGTISSISGKITNLAGHPIFHGPAGFEFSHSISGIATKSGFTFTVYAGDTFTLTETLTAFTLAGTTSGVFLATHAGGASELQFATDKNFTSDFSATGTLIFTLTSGSHSGSTITVDHSAILNNESIAHIQTPARFVAEFLINSRE